jgi:hypothetical protein
VLLDTITTTNEQGERENNNNGLLMRELNPRYEVKRVQRKPENIFASVGNTSFSSSIAYQLQD